MQRLSLTLESTFRIQIRLRPNVRFLASQAALTMLAVQVMQAKLKLQRNHVIRVQKLPNVESKKLIKKLTVNLEY